MNDNIILEQLLTFIPKKSSTSIKKKHIEEINKLAKELTHLDWKSIPNKIQQLRLSCIIARNGLIQHFPSDIFLSIHFLHSELNKKDQENLQKEISQTEEVFFNFIFMQAKNPGLWRYLISMQHEALTTYQIKLRQAITANYYTYDDLRPIADILEKHLQCSMGNKTNAALLAEFLKYKLENVSPKIVLQGLTAINSSGYPRLFRNTTHVNISEKLTDLQALIIRMKQVAF